MDNQGYSKALDILSLDVVYCVHVLTYLITLYLNNSSIIKYFTLVKLPQCFNNKKWPRRTSMPTLMIAK